MSQIFTDLKCRKCNTETLTEEHFLDGYTEYCSSCGYLYESFLSDKEYAKCLDNETNKIPENC